MKRVLPFLLGVSTFLLLVPLLRADATPPRASAPQGFDVQRDGIERGKVEAVEYDSKSVASKRRMVIYTPPGYTKEKKYPVFYLLHGAGDNEGGWQRRGLAPIILDNLLADKKIVPMIVVMPNGSPQTSTGPGTALATAIMKQADTDKDGKVSEEELVAAARRLFQECDREKKGKVDEKQLAEAINRLLGTRTGSGFGPRRFGPSGFGNPAVFENDLLKDIIPYVESHYSVHSGPEARAVAGLSMGGGQALTIGLRHLDQFAWVGGFSSALFGGRGNLIRDPDDAKKKLRLLWVSCGDRDQLMDASKSFHNDLEGKKIPHVWYVDSGGHSWPVWKNDLYLLSQKLFRDKEPAR